MALLVATAASFTFLDLSFEACHAPFKATGILSLSIYIFDMIYVGISTLDIQTFKSSYMDTRNISTIIITITLHHILFCINHMPRCC